MRRLVVLERLNSYSIIIEEDGKIVEYYPVFFDCVMTIGRIYKTRVDKVLPSSNSVFLDLGADGKGFCKQTTEINNPRYSHLRTYHSDSNDLQVGDVVMAQVDKEAFGGKKVSLTTNIIIAGELLLMTPLCNKVSISKRIENPDVRESLLATVHSLIDETKGYGYIIRTDAATATKEEFQSEMINLEKLWFDILKKYEFAPLGKAFSESTLFYSKLIKDIGVNNINEILLSGNKIISKMKKDFPEDYIAIADKIKYNYKTSDMYLKYGFLACKNMLLNRYVPLKCGGNIVIDRTEAMTVIDVNSAKYYSNCSCDEAAFKVNLEAAEKIAEIVRLRNIGGIILVDFIDMKNEEFKEKLLKHLSDICNKDRMKMRVMGMTKLGLVEISRMRGYSSVYTKVLETCPCCGTFESVEKAEFDVAMAFEEAYIGIQRGVKRLKVLLKTPAYQLVQKYFDEYNCICDFINSNNVSILEDNNFSSYENYKIIEEC